MAVDAAARLNGLRQLASRLGFAVRRARKELRGSDVTRFTDVLNDVLDDIGAAITFEGTSIGNAPWHVQQELPLLAALASRPASSSTTTSA
eukprot:9560747-Heterocapsa_arctica.AAC.1